MNEEQLNQMAQSCACSIRNEFDEDFPELSLFELENECRFAFKAGARWYESLPLADRLSESEKEKIRSKYCVYKCGYARGDRSAKHGIILLESLFGKTLFNQTEQ